VRLVRRLVASVAFAVGAIWLATIPGRAAYSCDTNLSYSGPYNTGSLRVASITTADGVAATVDLFAVSVDSGFAVIHPVQYESGTSVDFLGVGTFSGRATDDGPTENCEANYVNWNVYTDGRFFGVYFCEDIGVQLSSTAIGNRFKMRYDTTSNCGPYPRWNIYLNGSIIDCRQQNGNVGQVSAGGEVYNEPNPALRLSNRVHYYDVDKHSSVSGVWSSWSNGESRCEPGYIIDLATADQFDPKKATPTP
jgi:hypothetical protein